MWHDKLFLMQLSLPLDQKLVKDIYIILIARNNKENVDNVFLLKIDF